jgi:hypothetical protein
MCSSCALLQSTLTCWKDVRLRLSLGGLCRLNLPKHIARVSISLTTLLPCSCIVLRYDSTENCWSCHCACIGPSYSPAVALRCVDAIQCWVFGRTTQRCGLCGMIGRYLHWWSTLSRHKRFLRMRLLMFGFSLEQGPRCCFQ